MTPTRFFTHTNLYLPGKIAGTKRTILIFALQKFRLGTYFVVLVLDGTQERFQILHSVVDDPNLRHNTDIFLNTWQALEKIGKQRKRYE